MSEEISREEIAALLARESEGKAREEAIEIMQINRDGVANMSWSEDRTKTLAAFDMAIKALSQQTEYHGAEDMDGLYYCPICQQTTTVVKDGKKCPKCGATMDELSTRAQQTEDAISRQYLQKQFQEKCETDCLVCDYDSPYGCGLIDNAPSVIPKQEPCEDAISRQAAIDTIESWLSCDDYNEAERHIMRATESILYDLPSVKPQEPSDISNDGTLTVNVEDGRKISRVLVCGANHWGGLYYPDEQELKTGHWIEDDMTYCGVDLTNYKCDKCGEIGGTWRKGLKPNKLPKYCMNCGTKMFEPQESEDKE